MTKEVQKIHNLGLGFSVDSQHAIFSISGPKDAVRLAARDAIFGLNITQGIIAEHVFQAEELKMKGIFAMPDELDQIDIRIDIHSFDRLILMCRYLECIGIPLGRDFLDRFSDGHTFYQYTLVKKDGAVAQCSAQLGFYLGAILEQAKENQAPLMVEDYKRPQNQNFWFADEINDDAANKPKAKRRELAQQFNMFNDYQRMTLDDRIKLTEAHIKHLVAKANLFADRHPNNPNNQPTDFGWFYLQAYKNRKLDYTDECKRTGNYDPIINVISYYNKQGFDLVRDDEVDAFRKLADKYWDLVTLLKTLNETKDQLEAEKSKTILQYLGFK